MDALLDKFKIKDRENYKRHERLGTIKLLKKIRLLTYDEYVMEVQEYKNLVNEGTILDNIRISNDKGLSDEIRTCISRQTSLPELTMALSTIYGCNQAGLEPSKVKVGDKLLSVMDLYRLILMEYLKYDFVESLYDQLRDSDKIFYRNTITFSRSGELLNNTTDLHQLKTMFYTVYMVSKRRNLHEPIKYYLQHLAERIYNNDPSLQLPSYIMLGELIDSLGNN